MTRDARGRARELPKAGAPDRRPAREPSARWGFRFATIGLALAAVVAVYAPSFRVPFLMDDQVAILDNASIRNGPFSLEAWSPPGDGNTVQGRPVLNASFAASYAAGGLDPAAHRAVNLGVHLANALLLCVVLVLLFRSPRWQPFTGDRAVVLAGFVSMLWALHPLQTLSVTYVAQRAESLVSFFYLSTLAAWFGARASERWRIPLVLLAVTSCGLGMLTKEVMVTAPVVVFVLDRMLFAGDGRPWPVSLRFGMAGLAATWGLLLWMLIENDFARGGSTGTAFITRTQYLQTQAYAIPLYLTRIFWPSGILFDHGERIVSDPWSLGLAAVGWLLLLALFGWLLRGRRFATATALALFFVLLTPTSSVVPVASQTIAEHRIYLASAIVIAGVVVAAERFATKRGVAGAAAGLGVLAGGLLGVSTWQQNLRLQDPVRMWEDVVARVPSSWRGFSNLAGAHAQRGNDPAAIAALDRSLALAPTQARSLYNRANARRRQGDPAGAERDYRLALEIEPGHAEARNNLAMLLKQRGDLNDAEEAFETVVRNAPDHASAWYNLARTRFERSDLEGSREAVDAFLALRPDAGKGWLLAGDLRVRLGDVDGAREAYRRALANGADPAEIAARLRLLDGR